MKKWGTPIWFLNVIVNDTFWPHLVTKWVIWIFVVTILPIWNKHFWLDGTAYWNEAKKRIYKKIEAYIFAFVIAKKRFASYCHSFAVNYAVYFCIIKLILKVDIHSNENFLNQFGYYNKFVSNLR